MVTKIFPALPAPYGLRVRRGDTIRRTVTWRSAPAGTDPPYPLVNLTGYSGVLYVAGTGTGTLTFGGAAGTIGILLSAHDTDLDAGGYHIHLVLTAPGGDIVTLLDGTLEIFE